MARIAGLTTLEKTASGKAVVIKLDVRKFENNSHLKNFFKEVGFEVEKYELKEDAKASIKDSADYRKRKHYTSVEDLMAALNS